MNRSLSVAYLLGRLARVVTNVANSSELKPVQWEALRYLSEANRFSRAPGALTAWLGVTKGTVSQTVKTLERDGYVTKRTDRNDGRSVRLTLTAAGHRVLGKDPVMQLATALHSCDERALATLESTLAGTLQRWLEERGGQAFGVCHTCRHFRQGAGERLEHRCGLLEVDLSVDDSGRLCIEHEYA